MDVRFKQMVKRTALVVFICFIIGCSGTTLRTYTDPSTQSGDIKSVAIFPMSNAKFLANETKEINRKIIKEFSQKNPNIKIIDPISTVDLMNKHGLTDEYSDFLRNFAVSGIPNVEMLKKIKSALGADVILQGEIFDIHKRDAGFAQYAITSLTVRFTLLSTQNGTTLWEATSDAKNEGGMFTWAAPSVYKTIIMATEEILSALPTLQKE